MMNGIELKKTIKNINKNFYFEILLNDPIFMLTNVYKVVYAFMSIFPPTIEILIFNNFSSWS